MGRRWRACWRLGEQERQEWGPGGSWWRLGEQERREWVVEARWRSGECGRRGRVCRAGVGWLVGWLLPLCPGARPGPPRL